MQIGDGRCAIFGSRSMRLVFRELAAVHRISPALGTLRVARFRDAKHNTHICLVYARKGMEEAPKNSVSTVPFRSWEDQEPGAAQACGD